MKSENSIIKGNSKIKSDKARIFIQNITKAFAIILLLISLSSTLLSSRFYIFDLFSHFQLQYLFAGTLLFIVLSFFKLPRFYIPLGVYLVGLIWILIIPISIVPEAIPEPDIFYINSNFLNNDTEQIVHYIEGLEAKSVALTENNPELTTSLEELYGTPAVYHNNRALSCAIFSKRDVEEAYVITDTTYPICVAKFQEYTLYVIHPMPPLGAETYKAQTEYFKEITALLDADEASDRQFIVTGDFNSTYYSGQFREYFGKYFEKNIYTWSTNSPISLPIDHALSNESIRVTKSDKLSSDHNGLMVTTQASTKPFKSRDATQ